MDAAQKSATSPPRRMLGILESGLGLAFSGFLTLLCFFPGFYILENVKSRHTERLAAICERANRDTPWTLSFSFGRALQTPALKAWHGVSAEIGAAQAALLECTRRNGRALRPS